MVGKSEGGWGQGGEELSMGQASGCAYGGEHSQLRGTGSGLSQGREGKVPASSLIRRGPVGGPGLTACGWGCEARSCPPSHFPKIKYIHDPEPCVLNLLGHVTVELAQGWNGQDLVSI